MWQRVSTASHGRLHERGHARPQAIAPLRRAVVAFARANGASAERREDIALAVSEALTAAVAPADGGALEGSVVVDAHVVERSLEVVVCDDGGPAEARDDDGTALGFGLVVIVHLADAFAIEGATPGRRVRMTFTLT